jgi:hypothetical protein
MHSGDQAIDHVERIITRAEASQYLDISPDERTGNHLLGLDEEALKESIRPLYKPEVI